MIEDKKEKPGIRRLIKKVPPLVFVFLSFILIILLGSVLLVLPISASSPAEQLSYINSFFLATSAVCVTGLSPIADLSVTLSVFGKIVMALLIQIGGLGLVTILSFLIVITGRRMNLSQANIVREALNQNGMAELRNHLKHIIIITASFELFGTVLNLFVFTKNYGFGEALGISIFHAISSFNNAGFDIIGDQSLIGYADDVLLNISTCLLVAGGGLGFLVYEDLFSYHKYHKLTIQTKLVLIVNGVLIVASTLLIKLFEGGDVTWMQSVFYAINLRTAGFMTFSLTDKLNVSTGVLSIFLMFVGGSPLSTAGGIKTTTLFVLLSSIVSFARGKQTVVYKREFTDEIKSRAFILLLSGMILILVGVQLMSSFEGSKFTFEQLLFEATSAFGTVGYTIGTTTNIGVGSKLVLCFLMYFGRLGPLAGLSLFNHSFNKAKENNVSYLSTDLMVG
jgi:trk system potassium uptake protein TrkH